MVVEQGFHVVLEKRDCDSSRAVVQDPLALCGLVALAHLQVGVSSGQGDFWPLRPARWMVVRDLGQRHRWRGVLGSDMDRSRPSPFLGGPVG